jgi:cyclopropane fatty-acyl-phospholipid synthase-like methyltransferase
MTDKNTNEDFRIRFYDSYVSGFNTHNAELSERDHRDFAAWASARYLPSIEHLAKDAKILELGSGHGRMLHFLKSQGFTNALGIDLSDEQVRIARAAGLLAEVADMTVFLETKHALYDAIILLDVVEHFSRNELLDLFGMMQKALKPAGTLLIQTANGEGLFPNHIVYGDLTHMTIFNPSSMEQLLRVTGFSEIHFSESAPLASGLKGIARSIAWKMIRLVLNIVRKIESGKTQKVWTENFICSARKI